MVFFQVKQNLLLLQFFSFIILYKKMLFKPATLLPFYLLKTRSYLVLLSKNKFRLLWYINLLVFLSHISKTKIPNKILHKYLLLQGYLLDDIQEHFTGKSREEETLKWDLSAKQYISVNAHNIMRVWVKPNVITSARWYKFLINARYLKTVKKAWSCLIH